MDIPSNPDQIAELITSIGELIVVEQRGIAAAEARVAELFAQAAHVADVTAATVMPAGTSPVRAHDLARLSLQAEFAALTRVPERTIVQRIGEAEVLVEQLPGTLAALAAGEISAGHARVIVDQVGDVEAADRAEFEARVLPAAKAQTASQLRQAARRLREKLHPQTIAVRHHAAKQERHVTLTPAIDGMSWLSILTTAPIASAAFGRLASLAADAKASGDARTRAQLMTDHAQSLLVFGVSGPASAGTASPLSGEQGSEAYGASMTGPTITLPTGETPDQVRDQFRDQVPDVEEITGRIVPTVHLTVPVLTLLGHEDQPASLEGYGPIDPETAARLSVNAKSFTRILTHPETGAVLSVGRDRYAPPVDLKRALAIRDTHCRAPGCARPAKGCDLDHTIAWSAGGETSVENLAHLCAKHHHLKHNTNWTLRHDPGGTLHWITPSGRTFTTEPDPPDWYPLEPLADPRKNQHNDDTASRATEC